MDYTDLQEGDIPESEEEEESEEEDDDEEEAEEMGEMRPPVVTSWKGPDGITVHGVICIDDGIIRLKNRCQLDDCSICLKPSTTHGKHQICCLPCGHMYGFSCIKKWLLQSDSSGKCPQCNTFCSFVDALLLYPARLCVTAHQKMETEEEAAYVFEGEDEEEDIMESEDEEDEEEAEQLEEMRPPVVTSWMGPDGITVHGIMCIDDGIIRLKNRCQFDDCSICYKPSTTHGNHQLCCLPCGHMYGFSCIKKWLLQSDSSGKCPQCNTLCSFEDALLLYPPRLCVTAHQKASSAAFFPFNEQGFLEFKEYEYARMHDASNLRAADVTHVHILMTKHNDLAYRMKRLARRWVKLITRAKELEERAECLGLADALRRRAAPLKPRIKALQQRTDALERLYSALTRRVGALEQRYDAFESRVIFYCKMFLEHHKREKEIAKVKHALERKDSLAEKAAAKAKIEGEKEAEIVAEKKLKDKEKKDEKKMQESGTVDVPEEEIAEDVAGEPEEEKVEVKEKPTTKTTESVRVKAEATEGRVLTQSQR